MSIELPYNFQNLDTSGLQNATDNSGDIIGKALPASYLDANFQQLAKVVYVSSTPPDAPYQGMIWLDTVNGVTKQYDGTEWVSNIDKLDGYHASQTPTANTVPVSNSSGKIADAWGNKRAKVYTSSGYWEVPSGITSITVIAVAGGGGGGGARSTNGGAAGGGGYGGNIACGEYTVSSGETITITIGSGGSGGMGNPPSSGGSGGTTSVVGSASGTIVGVSGGSGGGGADVSGGINVGSGRRGMAVNVSGNYYVHGGEGGAGIGSGGAGAFETGGGSNGQNGSGYGCGGGGAATAGSSTYTATGGSGTGGIVIIYY